MALLFPPGLLEHNNPPAIKMNSKYEACQGIAINALTPSREQSIAAMKRKISPLILMCGVYSFVDKANLSPENF